MPWFKDKKSPLGDPWWVDPKDSEWAYKSEHYVEVVEKQEEEEVKPKHKKVKKHDTSASGE